MPWLVHIIVYILGTAHKFASLVTQKGSFTIANHIDCCYPKQRTIKAQMMQMLITLLKRDYVFLRVTAKETDNLT